MLGLELDLLRAEKRALRTGKGGHSLLLQRSINPSNFYIFEIHAVFNIMRLRMSAALRMSRGLAH